MTRDEFVAFFSNNPYCYEYKNSIQDEILVVWAVLDDTDIGTIETECYPKLLVFLSL